MLSVASNLIAATRLRGEAPQDPNERECFNARLQAVTAPATMFGQISHPNGIPSVIVRFSVQDSSFQSPWPQTLGHHATGSDSDFQLDNVRALIDVSIISSNCTFSSTSNIESPFGNCPEDGQKQDFQVRHLGTRQPLIVLLFLHKILLIFVHLLYLFSPRTTPTLTVEEM